MLYTYRCYSSLFALYMVLCIPQPSNNNFWRHFVWGVMAANEIDGNCSSSADVHKANVLLLKQRTGARREETKEKEREKLKALLVRERAIVTCTSSSDRQSYGESR